MKTYTIAINGQKAIDVARKIQGYSCYKRLVKNGKYLANIEIVLDDEEIYNGKVNKWVDVSYIESYRDLFETIKLLAKLGFNGCYCLVVEESDEEYGYKVDELFSFTLGESLTTKEDEA